MFFLLSRSHNSNQQFLILMLGLYQILFKLTFFSTKMFVSHLSGWSEINISCYKNGIPKVSWYKLSQWLRRHNWDSQVRLVTKIWSRPRVTQTNLVLRPPTQKHWKFAKHVVQLWCNQEKWYDGEPVWKEILEVLSYVKESTKIRTVELERIVKQGNWIGTVNVWMLSFTPPWSGHQAELETTERPQTTDPTTLEPFELL